MFQQFDEILGVRKVDFMTGIEQIPDAVSNFLLTAREKTAAVELQARWIGPNELEAQVIVQNKAGHRFPSGVGFRRAFLEFLVLDRSRPEAEQIVWSSGRTNELGVLVDQTGRPLPSEFFERVAGTDKQHYQPHHEVITSSDQAQIYEVLLWNTKHEFTTSFIHGCDTVKDNRLLPTGWRKDGRHPALTGYFLKATYPGPDAIHDPDYTNGRGRDATLYRVQLPPGLDRDKLSIRATLYYQAIPPYFLHALFTTSPDGPATQRLHFLCSNMKLAGTAIEDWKLQIALQEIPGPAYDDHH
jgi:hypothetical protein